MAQCRHPELPFVKEPHLQRCNAHFRHPELPFVKDPILTLLSSSFSSPLNPLNPRPLNHHVQRLRSHRIRIPLYRVMPIAMSAPNIQVPRPRPLMPILPRCLTTMNARGLQRLSLTDSVASSAMPAFCLPIARGIQAVFPLFAFLPAVGAGHPERHSPPFDGGS
jgi:hypothetical protein